MNLKLTVEQTQVVAGLKPKRQFCFYLSSTMSCLMTFFWGWSSEETNLGVFKLRSYFCCFWKSYSRKCRGCLFGTHCTFDPNMFSYSFRLQQHPYNCVDLYSINIVVTWLYPVEQLYASYCHGVDNLVHKCNCCVNIKTLKLLIITSKTFIRTWNSDPPASVTTTV